jgi:hypothetical protein
LDLNLNKNHKDTKNTKFFILFVSLWFYSEVLIKMALEIFSPGQETIRVFIAYSDLAWAMETNLIPGAETHLAINSTNGDYAFFSFGDNIPPGWYDCGLIPDFPILDVRANIARELYKKASWENCTGDRLPPEVEAVAEDPAFMRSWRGAAFAEDYSPFTAEENPITAWLASLAEQDIEVKLMRG